MSSERRTIHGETPDGVVERAEGYTHNPNPDDELALQRARFAEQQRQLQADRHQAAEAISEVSEKLGEQYAAAQHDPAHLAFVPEQFAELEESGTAIHGGSGYTTEETRPSVLPSDDVVKRVPTEPAQDVAQDNDRQ